MWRSQKTSRILFHPTPLLHKRKLLMGLASRLPCHNQFPKSPTQNMYGTAKPVVPPQSFTSINLFHLGTIISPLFGQLRRTGPSTVFRSQSIFLVFPHNLFSLNEKIQQSQSNGHIFRFRHTLKLSVLPFTRHCIQAK